MFMFCSILKDLLCERNAVDFSYFVCRSIRCKTNCFCPSLNTFIALDEYKKKNRDGNQFTSFPRFTSHPFQKISSKSSILMNVKVKKSFSNYFLRKLNIVGIKNMFLS